MAVSICFLTVSAMAGVTLAAITTGSVISPPATRAGMSAQPLGGGKRPICEVLIRVRLRRMFPSSLVSAFDPGHDHTTDCNRTRSGADALGDGYPGGTDPIGVLTGVPAARRSGSFQSVRQATGAVRHRPTGERPKRQADLWTSPSSGRAAARFAADSPLEKGGFE